MDNGSSSKISIKRQVGEGYFTANGALKSREELRQNVEKTTTEEQSAVSSSVVTNALGRVDQRFRAEVGVAASDLNRREAQIKQSKTDLKAERKALSDLKDAFDSDDQDSIDKAQSQLLDVRAARAERQQQLEREQRVGGNIRRISVGNKEIDRIELPEVKLSKVEEDAPKNKKQVKEQLEIVKADLQALKELKLPIKQSREELAGIYEAGQQGLSQVGENSVKSLENGEKLVSKITEEAKSLTAGELVSSAFGKSDVRAISLVLNF